MAGDEPSPSSSFPWASSVRRRRRWATSSSSLLEACARWLTPARVRVYCSALLCSSIVVAAAAIALGDPPFDAFGRPIAEDFVAKMVGGRIAGEGRIADLYDVALQRETQDRILGAPDHYRNVNPFLSPPFVAVLHAPLAALPYGLATVVWTAISIGLLVGSLAALRPLLPSLQASEVLLVAFSSLPVVELIGDGQDSALSLAILVGGLRLLAAGHDAAAGAVLGLGVFKPQIFLLLPVLLVFERRWRAALAWCVIAGGLVAVSIALVGLDGAAAYVSLLESDLYRQAIGEELRWKMQSIPALVGALLPPSLRPTTGLIVNASFSIAGAAILFFSLRGRHHRERANGSIALPFALAVLLGACMNPHFFLYDCTVLLLPILVLVAAAPNERRIPGLLFVGFVLLWTAPVRHAAFGELQWPASVLAAPWAAGVIAALAASAAARLRVRTTTGEA